MALTELNKVERSVHAMLRGMLERLHDLETARVDLTQKAMTTYIKITAEELPAQISDPVSSEVLPMLEVIDSSKNMDDWMDKETRSNPAIEPGSHALIEYERLEHCPDDQRSLGMLQTLGGGPLKEVCTWPLAASCLPLALCRWLLCWLLLSNSQLADSMRAQVAVILR